MQFWKQVEPAKHKYLWGWMALMAAVYLCIGILSISVVQGEKISSANSHALRMAADQVEPGRTPPDPVPAQGGFVPVTIGV
jgi:hypothetical protein